MMRISTLAVAALLITGTLATTACGQSQGGGPAAQGSRLSPDSLESLANSGRMKGSESAPITIVEISDFQCPYCREFATSTYPQIDSVYVKTGKARVLYINLPLTSHRQAFGAAEAAMCAGVQGKFWQMHDRLFATQREWTGQADAGQRFERFAQELQLNMADWRDCTANDRAAPLIVGDAMQAAEARITGTPMFILNSRNGQRSLSGALPFADFAREIDALLAAPAAPPASGAPAPQTPPAPAQP
ncbi:MAG TPA: thioredoxin domain-containing protein [Longimicrobium sp.]|nr:thioredoxin domain-containing protein [Longimicrobium sp.]